MWAFYTDGQKQRHSYLHLLSFFTCRQVISQNMDTSKQTPIHNSQLLTHQMVAQVNFYSLFSQGEQEIRVILGCKPNIRRHFYCAQKQSSSFLFKRNLKRKRNKRGVLYKPKLKIYHNLTFTDSTFQRKCINKHLLNKHFNANSTNTSMHLTSICS